jgi:hypothetical protein
MTNHNEQLDFNVKDCLEGLSRTNPIFAANLGSFIESLQAKCEAYDDLALYLWKFAIPQHASGSDYKGMLEEIKARAIAERQRIKDL